MLGPGRGRSLYPDCLLFLKRSRTQGRGGRSSGGRLDDAELCRGTVLSSGEIGLGRAGVVGVMFGRIRRSERS